jgi:hypothetical protein
MCIPMAAAALVATVASAAVSAYGAYQQSSAQKTAMKAEADATDRERVAAGERADLQAQRVGQDVSDARGRATAAMGASGVDITSGSSQATLARTDYYGLLDQQTVAKNAQDLDFNYRDRSSQLRSGAAQIRPWMSAGGSLLSSAGKVAQSWYNYASKS